MEHLLRMIVRKHSNVMIRITNTFPLMKLYSIPRGILTLFNSTPILKHPNHKQFCISDRKNYALFVVSHFALTNRNG